MNILSVYTINDKITITLLIVMLLIIFGIILYYILKNPYYYPYFECDFDVSGKRNINIENYIDNFLRIPKNWKDIQAHMRTIEEWKSDSQQHADSCVLKKYRNQQRNNTIDDNHAFCFQTIRMQTRYRQVNYVKHAYKVRTIHSSKSVSFSYLEQRYQKLKAIGFETTLSEYEQKNQRNLMTSALKNKIKLRDNFTCQMCGKYMPDEVGLHIDHIVPIAAGGKSVPSNLQVLCSKCNGRKGAK